MQYAPELKEAAKRLYLRRCKPREIQAQLSLPNIRIIYYWIRQGEWDDMLSDEEPLTAVGRVGPGARAGTVVPTRAAPASYGTFSGVY